LFLTGDEASVRRLTDAVGFRFTKTGKHLFLHPNVLIVLAKDRKIIRYLYGPTFLPFDIGMALTEAERGTPAVSIRKLISYCFSYEPEKKTYVFTAVRYFAGAILLVLGAFLYFVILRKK
ncbi:MAG: SCO family protein, partial [Candidatus Melainabacteria bacterium HGW-Melainabacteria-1]